VTLPALPPELQPALEDDEDVWPAVQPKSAAS